MPFSSSSGRRDFLDHFSGFLFTVDRAKYRFSWCVDFCNRSRLDSSSFFPHDDWCIFFHLNYNASFFFLPIQSHVRLFIGHKKKTIHTGSVKHGMGMEKNGGIRVPYPTGSTRLPRTISSSFQYNTVEVYWHPIKHTHTRLPNDQWEYLGGKKEMGGVEGPFKVTDYEVSRNNSSRRERDVRQNPIRKYLQ